MVYCFQNIFKPVSAFDPEAARSYRVAWGSAPALARVLFWWQPFLRFTCRFPRQWLCHTQMSVPHAWLLIMLIFLWPAQTMVGAVITFRVIFFFFFHPLFLLLFCWLQLLLLKLTSSSRQRHKRSGTYGRMANIDVCCV